MSSDTLALLSILVVIMFFAVLCGFLAAMTQVLRSTARRISDVSSLSAGIRTDCEVISSAPEGMNNALYVVASNLAVLGDITEMLPAGPGSSSS